MSISKAPPATTIFGVEVLPLKTIRVSDKNNCLQKQEQIMTIMARKSAWLKLSP